MNAPLPLDFPLGPHAALTLQLIEDHKVPGHRIYTLSAIGKEAEVGLTGEELEALCVAWQEEKQRRFNLAGVALP